MNVLPGFGTDADMGDRNSVHRMVSTLRWVRWAVSIYAFPASNPDWPGSSQTRHHQAKDVSTLSLRPNCSFFAGLTAVSSIILCRRVVSLARKPASALSLFMTLM